MKPFLIITILCFVGLQNVWCQTNLMNNVFLSFADNEKTYLEECGQDLKLDAYLQSKKSFGIFYAITGFQSKKLTCFLACYARKHAESQGYTLHEGYLAMINSIKIYNVDVLQKLYKELKSKGEYCYAKELNECEYFACLEVTKPPFWKFFSLIIRPFIPKDIFYRFHQN